MEINVYVISDIYITLLLKRAIFKITILYRVLKTVSLMVSSVVVLMVIILYNKELAKNVPSVKLGMDLIVLYR